MKRLSWIRLWILVISFPWDGFGQSFEWIADDFRGSMCLGITELDSNIYAIISNGPLNGYDSSIDYKLSVKEIELNIAGNLSFIPVERFTLSNEEHFATICADYIDDTKEWMIIQSQSNEPGKQYFRFLLTDENFNIESTQFLDTLGNLELTFYIDSYNGHTIVLGSVLGPPGDQVIFLDYNHLYTGILPPIQFEQTYPKKSTWVTSMRLDHRTGNMIVFFYNGIQILDTSLFQINRFTFNEIHTAFHGDVMAIEPFYYSHGAYRKDIQHSGLKRILVQKYDTLFTILKSDTLGSEDHDNYPFSYKSIEFRNNELFVGGHLDGPFSHFPVYPSIKKFYLAKYDEDLNRIWYHEYGGDKAYWMTGLKLLADKTCLAYGFITDTIDGHRNAYIMHVDKNGDIISSIILDNYQKSSIQVVNPGNESLQILNPQLITARFHLFDIQGCQILEEGIDQESESINVDFLPPAVYPYSIVQDGRIISSGKWVKL